MNLSGTVIDVASMMREEKTIPVIKVNTPNIGGLLNKSITEIDESYFYNSATDYYIKNTGEYAFRNCYSLNKVTLPEGITHISMSSFESCNELTSVNLPNSVEFLNERCFCDTGLTSLKIPRGVKEIHSYALGECFYLRNVTFNSKPTNLDKMAFEGCATLTTINVPWSEGEVANAPWGATNATINYNYTGE